MLKTSILSIGDEILIGQILNSNSKWLAERITNLGTQVIKISTVGDSRSEILNELDNLLNISDILIITGGLGPTHDDITKDVLCEYFNDALAENIQWTEKLKEQFKDRGEAFLIRNKPQAFIPSKSNLLWNQIGTAPGMLFLHNDKLIISLPGVPQEMMGIMVDNGFANIKKFLEGKYTDTVIYKNIQTNNIPESTLADLIDVTPEILGKSTLAFLPSYRGVKLRIGAYGLNSGKAQEELDRLSNYIVPRIEKYIIGYDEKPYAEIIAELLTASGETLSVAESCTGGMLGSAITAIPGSSKYFQGGIIAYSNEIKINILGADKSIIDKYGAVSRETAVEMSRNAVIKFDTDYAVSVTGIAGPDGGTYDKPVGTVWISISDATGDYPKLLNMKGTREMIRERTTQSAMVELIKFLKQKYSAGKKIIS